MTFENKEKEIGFSAAILFIFLIKIFFFIVDNFKAEATGLQTPIHTPSSTHGQSGFIHHYPCTLKQISECNYIYKYHCVLPKI